MFFIATAPDTTQPLIVLLKPVLTAKLESTWKLIWDFGDSSNRVEKHDTIPIVHIYSHRDSFIVTLVLLDTILKDSIYIKDTIDLGASIIQPKTDLSTLTLAFTYSTPVSSSPLSIQFIPTLSTQLENNWKLIWDFGDFSPTISKYDFSPFVHEFNSHDYYTVKLILKDIATNDSIFVTKNINLRLSEKIDSNQLHQFTKVLVQISGSHDYYDGTPSNLGFIVKDSGTVISSLGVFPDSSYPSRWQMNMFVGYSSYSVNTDGPPTTEHSNRYTSFKLQFSRNSNQIDSGIYYYKNTVFRQWKWGTDDYGQEESVSFNTIPILSIEPDTIEYQLRGSGLRSAITTLIKTSYNKQADDAKKFNSINWESGYTPTLTIKLFK